MCACGMRSASKNRSAVVVAMREPREAKLTASPSYPGLVSMRAYSGASTLSEAPVAWTVTKPASSLCCTTRRRMAALTGAASSACIRSLRSLRGPRRSAPLQSLQTPQHCASQASPEELRLRRACHLRKLRGCACIALAYRW